MVFVVFLDVLVKKVQRMINYLSLVPFVEHRTRDKTHEYVCVMVMITVDEFV